MGKIKEVENQTIIGLAGNPNTGKSTLFNNLTGLNQHTGNWPGKTVANAKGQFTYKNIDYSLVDLPGTYSLFINSQEEEIARDFICFGHPKITIVVVDGTSLERNLNLVLQVMEATDNIIVCVNLMDEVEKKGIEININKLKTLLNVPVIPIIARDGIGVEKLLRTIDEVNNDKINISPKRIVYDKKTEELIQQIESILSNHIDANYNFRWMALRLIDGDKTMQNSIKNLLFESNNNIALLEIENILKDNTSKDERIVTTLYKESEKIAREVIYIKKSNPTDWDKKLDDILTSKKFGFPIMILLLALVFWITIIGSNYPSELLFKFFFALEHKLSKVFLYLGPPLWLHDMLILGVYRTLAWVIAVMLPPMAIFFPLFTLLEDLGYLPRIAFNLDNSFRKSGAHGKQALTMSMGFGCNAAGVMACRIIDSPREKLVAIITNNFVPCNGRFPIFITISTIFIGQLFNEKYSSIFAALAVLTLVIIGVLVTLLVSNLLSKTILKGTPSSFTLELPPYRKPQIGKVLVRSVFDRTLFVLARAIMIAAPAGIIIWIFANMSIGGESILNITANFLDPFAKLLGLDGFILIAFLLGLPANEIILPILTMSYMSKGAMLEFNNINVLKALLLDNGWTILTALNFMIFALLHFPCGTTLLTIKNETGGIKWPLFTFILTTSIAILVTFIINMLFQIIF